MPDNSIAFKIDEKHAISEPVYKPRVYTIFVAEILGTALLMFLGCMGTVRSIVDLPVIPHFPGITFGLTVLLVIQTIGHISGAHLNPQVTVAAAILGKIKPCLIPVYIVAEFIGAVLGFYLLTVVTPEEYSDSMCETTVQQKLTLLQAVTVEVIITFALILVCGAVWDSRNSKLQDSVPIRFGFIIACFSMVAGPYTGASMNTARTFAPALLNNHWENQWVYWVGPSIGALAGAVVYKYILGPPKSP